MAFHILGLECAELPVYQVYEIHRQLQNLAHLLALLSGCYSPALQTCLRNEKLQFQSCLKQWKDRGNLSSHFSLCWLVVLCVRWGDLNRDCFIEWAKASTNAKANTGGKRCNIRWWSLSAHIIFIRFLFFIDNSQIDSTLQFYKHSLLYNILLNIISNLVLPDTDTTTQFVC